MNSTKNVRSKSQSLCPSYVPLRCYVHYFSHRPIESPEFKCFAKKPAYGIDDGKNPTGEKEFVETKMYRAKTGIND